MVKQGQRVSGSITLGSTVTLTTLDERGWVVKFTVVDREEVDPRKGWISAEAPLARAVIGRRAGDEVLVPTPREDRSYRIVSATGG